jgi:hypothetical protein
MKLMPQGDYYVWDCDWCDSHNRTLWTRIEDGMVVCGACYAKFSLSFIAAGSSPGLPHVRQGA